MSVIPLLTPGRSHLECAILSAYRDGDEVGWVVSDLAKALGYNVGIYSDAFLYTSVPAINGKVTVDAPHDAFIEVYSFAPGEQIPDISPGAAMDHLGTGRITADGVVTRGLIANNAIVSAKTAIGRVKLGKALKFIVNQAPWVEFQLDPNSSFPVGYYYFWRNGNYYYMQLTQEPFNVIFEHQLATEIQIAPGLKLKRLMPAQEPTDWFVYLLIYNTVVFSIPSGDIEIDVTDSIGNVTDVTASVPVREMIPQDVVGYQLDADNGQVSFICDSGYQAQIYSNLLTGDANKVCYHGHCDDTTPLVVTLPNSVYRARFIAKPYRENVNEEFAYPWIDVLGIDCPVVKDEILDVKLGYTEYGGILLMIKSKFGTTPKEEAAILRFNFYNNVFRDRLVVMNNAQFRAPQYVIDGYSCFQVTYYDTATFAFYVTLEIQFTNPTYKLQWAGELRHIKPGDVDTYTVEAI